MLRPEHDMAKKNKVAEARKAFVQARASATGKTTAEDKAKFRQRFEKLATTQQGRKKIADVTGIAGIRKELKTAYAKPSTTTGTTNTTTGTTNTTSNLSKFVGTPAPKVSEAKMESGLRANPRVKKMSEAQFEAKLRATAKPVFPAKTESGTSTTKKVVIGAGIAGAAYGLSNRAYKLSQIADLNARTSALGMNPAEVQAQLQGIGYKPESIGSAVRGWYRANFGGGGARPLGR